MQRRGKPYSFYIFDLDDTLYPEIEFVRSGLQAIALRLLPLTRTNISDCLMNQYKRGGDVFQWILDNVDSSGEAITKEGLLKLYREHLPSLRLREDAKSFLQQLARQSIPAGLITDGRSITQRNKIKVLQLENYFSDIIISEEFGSEKPNEKNFQYFADKYSNHRFCYIGDNTQKDFIIPARLGWGCICIRDKGYNIHPQYFNLHPNPLTVIDSFYDIPC